MTPVCAFGYFKAGRKRGKKIVDWYHYFPVQETPITLWERFFFPFPWFFFFFLYQCRKQNWGLQFKPFKNADHSMWIMAAWSTSVIKGHIKYPTISHENLDITIQLNEVGNAGQVAALFKYIILMGLCLLSPVHLFGGGGGNLIKSNAW